MPNRCLRCEHGDDQNRQQVLHGCPSASSTNSNVEAGKSLLGFWSHIEGRRSYTEVRLCTLKYSRVSCLLITLRSSSASASLSRSITPISGRICSWASPRSCSGVWAGTDRVVTERRRFVMISPPCVCTARRVSSLDESKRPSHGPRCDHQYDRGCEHQTQQTEEERMLAHVGALSTKAKVGGGKSVTSSAQRRSGPP